MATKTPSKKKASVPPVQRRRSAMAETQNRMNSNIRLLFAEQRRTPADMSRETGIDKGAISRSLSEVLERRRGWTIGEAALIAEFFDVPLPHLFDEPPRIAPE